MNNRINKSAIQSTIKKELTQKFDVSSEVANEVAKVVDSAPTHMMRQPVIKTFYNIRQVLDWNNNTGFSKSPSKPKLLLKFLANHGFASKFQVRSCFKPYDKKDLMIAHTEQYVDDVFNGTGLCDSNSVPWKPEFPETVRYTNASLYNAIRYANKNPEFVTFSPTSGFHHARPSRGGGFCTFSGQVIASIKMWKLHKKSGAYIDLDGHFGNSIEDSRNYFNNRQALTADDIRLKANLDLIDKAIPRGFNINPSGAGKEYLKDLELHLKKLKAAIIAGQIHYVVFCHGADSHNMDDLGGQVNTKEWVKAAEMVYQMINDVDAELGRPVPFTMALFGGYRTDDYNSVLSLHTASLTRALDMLCGDDINYTPEVKNKISRSWINEEEKDEFDIDFEKLRRKNKKQNSTPTSNEPYVKWQMQESAPNGPYFVKQSEGDDKMYFAGFNKVQVNGIINRLNASKRYHVKETDRGLEVCWNIDRTPRAYDLMISKVSKISNVKISQ